MDFNRVFNLFTQKYTASFGTFGGRASFSVFPREASARRPVIKALFSPSTLYQFKQILKKSIDSEDFKPIELGFCPFNKETKVNVFRAGVTVGRDQEKVIYLEFTGDEHKEPIRFYPEVENGYRINGQEVPKKHQSEMGVGALIDSIDHILYMSTQLTRRGNEPGIDTPTPNPTPGVGGGDVPF